MSVDRTPSAMTAGGTPGRSRIRAERFHLVSPSVFVRLAALAGVLLAGTVVSYVLGQPTAAVAVAVPALIAGGAALWAFSRSRVTVSIDTDGVRFRQGGRVRAIVSWSDYRGWQQEPGAILLLQDREEPVRVPTGSRSNAWAGLTAALDAIRPPRNEA
jgi:hypothetical protein